MFKFKKRLGIYSYRLTNLFSMHCSILSPSYFSGWVTGLINSKYGPSQLRLSLAKIQTHLKVTNVTIKSQSDNSCLGILNKLMNVLTNQKKDDMKIIAFVSSMLSSLSIKLSPGLIFSCLKQQKFLFFIIFCTLPTYDW